MSLQSMVRWFLPREDHFYSYLESQAELALEAAIELGKFREQGSVREEVRDVVQRVEHRADEVVRQMEDALARTFVTPLDREDLHKLSSELDDVVDLINLAMRAAVLYGVERPTEPMVKLIEMLIRGTEIVKQALPLLRTHAYPKLIEECRKLRSLEKDADVVYRSAISRLFHDPGIDARVLLREKEVLEDLERAVDRCDDLADTLTNVAVKHG